MKKLVLALAMALALGFAAPTAEAKEGAWSVGADLGLVFPSDNIDSRVGFGVDVRYGIAPDWDLAFNGLFSTKNSLGIHDYHVAGYYLYEGFYFGVKLGFTKAEVSATVGAITVTASNTDFSFGPSVGYQYEVAENLSIGPQADFIITAGDSDITKFNLLAKVMYTFN